MTMQHFMPGEDAPQPRYFIPHNLIIRSVAKAYGITIEDIQRHGRQRARAHPRQVAMYLLCTMTHLTLPDIGRRLGGEFGGYDHSTILFGRDTIIDRMREQPALVDLIKRLRRNIESAARRARKGEGDAYRFVALKPAAEEAAALHVDRLSPNGKASND